MAVLSQYKSNLLFLIAFKLLWISAVSQNYDITDFRESEFVSDGYIYALSKDSLGYIWIGTDDGLISFNGKSFRRYTTNDSLAENFVTTAIRDGKYMWFGHMNGSVTFYNGRQFLKFKGNQESGPVTSFGKDSKNRVYVCTYNGFFLEADPERGLTGQKSFKTDSPVLDFCFVGKDSLLVGTGSGLFLCNMKSADVTEIRKFEETQDLKILKIVKKISGKGYYAASAEGIVVINNKISVDSIISGFNDVQSVCEDHHQNLWIATFGQGLINYNIDKGTITDMLNEYTGDYVKAVFEGSDGNIWVGGYGSGLARISNRVFTIINFQKDYYGNHVRAICHQDEFAWIATEKGLLKTDLKGTVINFKAFTISKITDLCLDTEDNVWIGTESEGMYVMENSGILKKYPISDGILENSVTSVACSGRQLWIGTKKGLCSIDLLNLDIKWYTISNGLPHNSINGICTDVSGKLWISTRSNVLACIIDDRVHRNNMPLENSAISFSGFTVDSESYLWTGSLGNGLFRIKADSLISLTTRNGLYSDFCHAVISDNYKHVWAVHKDGISRIGIKNYFIRAYNKFDITGRIISFNANAASADREGKIWFGTEEGILIIDQSKETEGVPPVPEILSVKVNDQEQTFDHSRIVLKPGNYNIEFVYSAISQKEPDLVTYQVFFEGYDQKPELTRLSSVLFHNVAEGNYVFRLSAINGDGISSPTPVEIRFLIRTPILKQWWFYMLLVILAGIVTILYIKSREYRFKTERKILEEKVLERTQEIEKQKNEIECQRDLIEAKNAEITSSIRYALEIQNALLPSESKIDRYFPENFIFLRPKDIVSGDFYWMARRNDRIVFSVADCTGHGVPGAFMSMLSISILNEIVNVEGITDSDKIVNRLHFRIHKSLNRSRADGLDMALCSYDWTNRVIQFTGAMNHLIYIHDGELKVIKSDQYSVNMSTDETVTFTRKEINIHKGDIIYLYTDGYMDQFGGEKDKKFSIRRFYNLLREIYILPMKEQESLLEQKLTQWKNDNVQTDDITIMGIRF